MSYKAKYIRKSELNTNKDSITFEEAKKRFHEYYNKRSSSKIGRIRAKVGDMRYNKDDDKVLYPNKEGSAKYLLPEGPRTYDMYGLDYFPEEQKVTYLDDPEYGKIKVELRGKPKLKSGDSYEEYFHDKYNEREDICGNKNLVNVYWDKYYKKSVDEGKPLNRSRKGSKKIALKKGDKITDSYFILGVNELFFEYADDIYYLDSTMNVYDFNHKFIGNLNDLDNNMKRQLVNLNYVKKKSNGSLVWDNDIYGWDIYYEYEDGNKYKLDMNDMMIYSIKDGNKLGHWNEYIVENNIDYRKMVPYKIDKKDGNDIINSIIVDEINEISAEDTLKESAISTADKLDETVISVEDTLKEPTISTADKLDETLISAEDTLKEPAISTADKLDETVISAEDTLKEPAIPTADKLDETVISAEDTLKEPAIPTADKLDETVILAEDILKEPAITTDNKLDEPVISTEDILKEPAITTDDKLNEPVISTEDITKENIKSDKDKKPEIDEELLTDIGFSLVNRNNKYYYLNKNNNKLISIDNINHIKNITGFDMDIDILNDINIPVIASLIKYENF
jgi:hypothetical protein